MKARIITALSVLFAINPLCRGDEMQTQNSVDFINKPALNVSFK